MAVLDLLYRWRRCWRRCLIFPTTVEDIDGYRLLIIPNLSLTSRIDLSQTSTLRSQLGDEGAPSVQKTSCDGATATFKSRSPRQTCMRVSDVTAEIRFTTFSPP